MFDVIWFQAMAVIAAGAALYWLAERLLRPKPLPLPPEHVMSAREQAFAVWLAVLYRDHPAATQTARQRIGQELDQGERIGQWDANFALFAIVKALEYTRGERLLGRIVDAAQYG